MNGYELAEKIKLEMVRDIEKMTREGLNVTQILNYLRTIETNARVAHTEFVDVLLGSPDMSKKSFYV